MRHPLDLLAGASGRLVARSSRWVVNPAPIVFKGELPTGGTIAVTWHELTMLALAVHATRKPEPYYAFVTPGIRGAAMRGWLKSNGMVPVPLPCDGSGAPTEALKQMARALGAGCTVAVALDGPRGPARVARPGALWLARLSGKPLVVVAAAARPAIHVPRWDRHLVPLPVPHIAVVYGEPILVDRKTEIDEALVGRVTRELDAAERCAWALVG